MCVTILFLLSNMKTFKIVIESIAIIFFLVVMLSEPVSGSWMDNWLIFILSKVFAGGTLVVLSNSIVSQIKKH